MCVCVLSVKINPMKYAAGRSTETVYTRGLQRQRSIQWFLLPVLTHWTDGYTCAFLHSLNMTQEQGAVVLTLKTQTASSSQATSWRHLHGLMLRIHTQTHTHQIVVAARADEGSGDVTRRFTAAVTHQGPVRLREQCWRKHTYRKKKQNNLQQHF